MQIGFIGLGKMGLEMSTRAIRGGHELVGFDNSTVAQEKAKEREIPVAASVEELVKTLAKRKASSLQLSIALKVWNGTRCCCPTSMMAATRMCSHGIRKPK